MLVGFKKTSPRDVVGKGLGNAPAARTPRETASTSSGIVRWQLLKPDPVSAMPTIGLRSISFDKPMDRAKDERRYSAKSLSP